jgi:hypothetical protein
MKNTYMARGAATGAVATLGGVPTLYAVTRERSLRLIDHFDYLITIGCNDCTVFSTVNHCVISFKEPGL